MSEICNNGVKDIYVLTVVEYGDKCNGKAEILGVFNSYSEAHKYFLEDLVDVMNDSGLDLNVDLIKMNAWDTGHLNGVEYNIHNISLT